MGEQAQPWDGEAKPLRCLAFRLRLVARSIALRRRGRDEALDGRPRGQLPGGCGAADDDQGGQLGELDGVVPSGGGHRRDSLVG